MKRVVGKYFNNYIATVWIILVSVLIGFISYCISQDKEVFYFCVGTGISIAVLLCAIAQNNIQKDNITLQLFDKRYQVYNTILETKTLLQRNNWGRYVIAHGNDVTSEVLDLEEKLNQVTQLSAVLFSGDIKDKMIYINDQYCRVADKYKSLLVAGTKILSTDEVKIAYLQVISEYLLSNETITDNIEFNNKLKSNFPQLYIPIYEFSLECQNYLAKIEETQILSLMEKEVVIKDLDK